MSLDFYFRFATAQGLRVFEGETCLWVEKRRFFLESIPPHRRVRPMRGEAARFFLRGMVLLRYTCPEGEGEPSFEYVCDEKGFGLHSLAGEARRHVRRGLDACLVRRVETKFLAKEAAPINRSVLVRHGRNLDSLFTDESRWEHYMAVCGGLSNVEAYGVFVNDRLCAFALAVLVDDYAYLFHTHAHSDYLKFSPMNALIFTVTRGMLARPQVRCVSQGLESFEPRPKLERFKLAMGFRKQPIGRKVSVNPVARPLFTGPGAWLVERALQRAKPHLSDEFCAVARSLRNRVVTPSACSEA